VLPAGVWGCSLMTKEGASGRTPPSEGVRQAGVPSSSGLTMLDALSSLPRGCRVSKVTPVL